MTDEATKWYERASRDSHNSRDRGIALRGYGRFLFSIHQIEKGREKFRSSLECLDGGRERDRGYVADTYERWAAVEEDWGDDHTVDDLLKKAAGEYQQLKNNKQRRSEVERVNAKLTAREAARFTSEGKGKVGAR